MSKALLIFTVIALALIGTVATTGCKDRPSSIEEGSAESQPAPATRPDSHIYWTWDTMEFDKCVAAWMIRRFIDPEAVFQFHAEGTTEAEGTPFDVPGKPWSRKHLKCTSDCVLETLNRDDPALQEIVHFAHVTELNRWQLDRFPDARRHFEEVRAVMNSSATQAECLERTSRYFDNVYNKLRNCGGAQLGLMPGMCGGYG